MEPKKVNLQLPASSWMEWLPGVVNGYPLVDKPLRLGSQMVPESRVQKQLLMNARAIT